MIASEIISNNIFPVKTSDTGEFALNLMADYNVNHLPIVNNEQLLGVISEEDILSHDIFEPIGSYKLTLIRAFAKESMHVFEVMDILSKNELTLVPVIDYEENYTGVITTANLLHYFSNSFSFKEPGSIIVLDIADKDYYLSELSRIIESENAVIISSFVTQEPNSTNLAVTLKVNRQDISRIIAALNRYDYSIKATFTEVEYVDGLKERFESLMNYLNI